MRISSKVIIILSITLVCVSALYSFNKVIVCKPQGYSEQEAIEIANQRMKTFFSTRKKTHYQNLVHINNVSYETENGARIWAVEYHSDKCQLVIYIDACGMADIGGVTLGCTQ